MPETDFAPVPDTYSAFVQELGAEEHEVRPDEQIRGLIMKAQDENLSDEQRQQARNEVIEANLRAIPFVIKRLPSSGIPPEELIGEGFEVLNSCINNFDPDYISPKTEDTVKFSSYLLSSLEAKFRHPTSVERVEQKLPLPAHVESYAGVMKKAREKFLQEHHKEPNVDEWYRATVDFLGQTRSFGSLKGFTPEVFKGAKVHNIEKPYIPIGKRTGRGNVNTDTLSTAYGNIEDTIADPEADVEEEAMKEFLKVDMEDAMASLPNRERLMLQLVYGIGLNEEGKENHTMSIEQAGKILGVTTTRAQQIKDKALRKLRHPSRAIRIRSYMEPDYEEGKASYEKNEYKNMIKEAAEGLLKAYTRDNLVNLLSRIRSKPDNRFNASALSEIFEKRDVDMFLFKERELKSSPLVLRNELLNEINSILQNIKEGKVELKSYDFDNRQYYTSPATFYWEHEDLIQPEEIVGQIADGDEPVHDYKPKVRSESKHMSGEYIRTISQMARSIINRCTPEEFKDLFARGMYVEGQNGRAINRVFGNFGHYMDEIEFHIKGTDKNIMSIGQDVALAITNELAETPRYERNRIWREVNDVTFDYEDYENWLKSLDEKVKRWG